MNEWLAKCLSSKRTSNSRGLRVFLVNCAYRSGRKKKRVRNTYRSSLTASSLSFGRKSAVENAEKKRTQHTREQWVVSVRAWYANLRAGSSASRLPTPALLACGFATSRSQITLTIKLAHSLVLGSTQWEAACSLSDSLTVSLLISNSEVNLDEARGILLRAQYWLPFLTRLAAVACFPQPVLSTGFPALGSGCMFFPRSILIAWFSPRLAMVACFLAQFK